LTELTPCEFFLFRYVPDVVRGEFINIGVLIRQSATPKSLVRFTQDWTRVQAVNPDADVILLEAIGNDLAERLRIEPVDRILKELVELLSNSIQIDGPHTCLAPALEVEMDRLMRLYIEPISQDNIEAD
jgi:hypothetical protein